MPEWISRGGGAVVTDAAETLTIDAFIEARLREDEQVARTAAEFFAGEGRRAEWREQWSGSLDVGDTLHELGDSTVSRHAERFDPARVLREVKAHRSIVSQYRLLQPFDLPKSMLAAFELNVRVIARIYADHPDFQEEWSA